MHPKEQALSGEEPEEEGAGFLSDMGQGWKAVSILDTKTKVTLGPLALRKAGAIVENMQNAGYSDEKINIVCRGLFCLDEESLQGTWLRAPQPSAPCCHTTETCVVLAPQSLLSRPISVHN